MPDSKVMTHKIYTNLQVDFMKKILDTIASDTGKYQGMELVKLLVDFKNTLDSGIPCSLGDDEGSSDAETSEDSKEENLSSESNLE